MQRSSTKGRPMVGLSTAQWSADGSRPGPQRRRAVAGDRVQGAEEIALVAGAVDAADRCRWTYGELLEHSERAARALLARFAPGEASPVITQTALDDEPADRATTLGRPLSHTEVKIVDVASGATVAPDVVGELCTRGYRVMTGYFDNPEATAAAIDAGGWLHTGDSAAMDARGYCRIGGRLTDMIIRGGENIYPCEIEQVLFDHEDVADVAVLGVADPTWGEQVAAFIRPAVGHTPDPERLFTYCRDRLAAHKTPRHWTVLDAFPLTPSGKVKKYVLRERFLAAAEAQPTPDGPDLSAAMPPAT
jgi:acyl-CoA synthetase (AMP-forming)/AMP-acid ligase II